MKRTKVVAIVDYSDGSSEEESKENTVRNHSTKCSQVVEMSASQSRRYKRIATQMCSDSEDSQPTQQICLDDTLEIDMQSISNDTETSYKHCKRFATHMCSDSEDSQPAQQICLDDTLEIDMQSVLNDTETSEADSIECENAPTTRKRRLVREPSSDENDSSCENESSSRSSEESDLSGFVTDSVDDSRTFSRSYELFESPQTRKFKNMKQLQWRKRSKLSEKDEKSFVYPKGYKEIADRLPPPIKMISNLCDSDTDDTNSDADGLVSSQEPESMRDPADPYRLYTFWRPDTITNDEQRREYDAETKHVIIALKKLVEETSKRDRTAIEPQPDGVKVELKPHQLRGLAFMVWRESLSCAGGIIADEMGLGKTALSIALIVRQKLLEQISAVPHRRPKYQGGTLIVVPSPSLIYQWQDEFEKFSDNGLLKIFIYCQSGAEREISAKRLARIYDVVITSYRTAAQEIIQTNEEPGRSYGPTKVKKLSTLGKIFWDRVILDEGHKIRNCKTNQAEAAFSLQAAKRWILTGTPIQNGKNDIYALLKFLRCSPFDAEYTWSIFICKDNVHGRFGFLLDNFMLRRTKGELKESGELESLPDKTIEIIDVHLNPEDQAVHEYFYKFLRVILEHLIYQEEPEGPAPEFFTRKEQKVLLQMGKLFEGIAKREFSQNQLFTLCIRLRQICCHPFLILKKITEEEKRFIDNPENDENSDDSDYEERNQPDVSRSTARKDSELDEDDDDEDFSLGVTLLSKNNPVFDRKRPSSKISRLMELLDSILQSGEKVIVVSYFSSFLEIIEQFIREKEIAYHFFSGKVSSEHRKDIISDINDPDSPVQVMLMSMLAGNLGLNLVGANNMIILDMNWNPQQELQAMDRIHRIGQTKNVKIFRFACAGTIDDYFLDIVHHKKIQIAENAFAGRDHTSLLTVEEMKKMLFMSKKSSRPTLIAGRET